MNTPRRVLFLALCLTTAGAQAASSVETSADWTESTVDASGQMGQHVSLALDRDGRAHLTYYEFKSGSRRQLRYARWTGQAWLTQTVDDSGFRLTTAFSDHDLGALQE
jgi:hypothetical protein